jgi:hypothetical protein
VNGKIVSFSVEFVARNQNVSDFLTDFFMYPLHVSSSFSVKNSTLFFNVVKFDFCVYHVILTEIMKEIVTVK